MNPASLRQAGAEAAKRLVEEGLKPLGEKEAVEKSLALLARSEVVMVGSNDGSGYPNMKAMFKIESEPYPENTAPEQASGWRTVAVEENGTLNLNRQYTARPGLAVTAEAVVNVAEEGEFPIDFGFSDHLKLWINGEPVYEGSWRWQPPANDGRITADLVTLPIRWHTGENRIRAELTCAETFGWGLCAAIRTNRSRPAEAQALR